MVTNRTAFLDAIAYSEGTDAVANSDNGYNVIVGGTLFFNNYADHPRVRVWIPRINEFSTAAGRYQILARYFDIYKKQLNLMDFGHDAQDAIALQMISECHALNDIDCGRFEMAIQKCASRWASFPNGEQAIRTMDALKQAYVNAGGTFDVTIAV